ncbi:MAG TPA: hypothetical protein VHT30_12495 [Acidimicrobiales bacterium]|jgi:hypothetical protein|nr:hypothetical protein [Acidimicrobiales bacterium]
MTTPHKDDEALSAILDGEDDAATVAHLGVCSTCQARLAALETVAREVATPVAGRSRPDIDAAIAGAMAAWPATAGRRVPLASRPRRVLMALGGVAAALVAVGVIVIVFRSTGGQTSKSGAFSPVVTGPSSTAPPVTPSVGLGAQSDSGAVARLLAPSLAPGSAAQASSSGAAPASPGPNAGTAFRTGQPGQLVAATCIEKLRAALGLPVDSTVALVASLMWRGEPAAAVVFDRPGGRDGAVVSLPGCAVLAILPI